MSGRGWRERVYRRRGLLASPPLVAALAWPAPPPGPGEWAGAALLFAAGVALRVWAQQHLPYRLEAPGELATDGPYARVRNPAYLGSVLVCTGAALASGVPYMAPVAAAWSAAVYRTAARFEEEWLTDRYGKAYRRYRRAVPGWVPQRSVAAGTAMVTPRLGRAAAVEARNLLVLAPFALKAFLV